jgi:hypothetical protein
MLHEGDVNSNKIYAHQTSEDVNDKHESRGQKYVYHVNRRDESSIPPEPNKVIMRKLEHLVKTEREVLGPVMREYYDLSI